MLRKQQIHIFLLLLLLVVNVFAVAIISVDFQLNQDFYTKNFCINKQKPELHCEGKCHLKKTLNKIEKQKNEKSSLSSFQLDFTHLYSFEFHTNSFLMALTHQTIYQNYYFSTHFSDIFHPPSC